MNNLIECDSCNKYIAGNQVQLKDTTVKSGIQKRTWQCPYCKKENLIIIMNKTIKRMMKENKEDRERIGDIHKKAKLLMDAGKLKKDQATKNIKEVEQINKRIDKRTKGIDEKARKLMDDYILSLRVDA